MMEIKIYTTPSCIWCQKAKEFFKANGIKYKEINVSASEDAAREMIKISGQRGTPVIVANSQVIVGFNEPSLRKALKLK